jgi:hypothetical protein
VKTKLQRILLASLASICVDASLHAQNLSSNNINGRIVERRAVEAVIWGMPVVNYGLMYQAMARNTTGTFNQIAYWSRLPDWKIQTLTPNPDEDSITGTVMDVWQSALEDVRPADVDKGQGGKYLILPPGYKDKVPTGYIPLPSDTYEGYALLRSIPKSGSAPDVAKAVAYGKRVKLYPLSQAAKPPATTFVDVVDIVYDSTITYDLRFFESLNRIVQAEPWLERDKAMIDQLNALIELTATTLTTKHRITVIRCFRQCFWFRATGAVGILSA